MDIMSLWRSESEITSQLFAVGIVGLCLMFWKFVSFFVPFIVWLFSVMMAVASACKDSSKMGIDNGKYVRYTPEQVEALERLYHECPKPSSLRRQQLIRECPILSNIEPKQIKVWFQNRRYIPFLGLIRPGITHSFSWFYGNTGVGKSSGKRHRAFKLWIGS